MFITKKKYQALEKRVADLEGQVQSQQSVSAEPIIRDAVIKVSGRVQAL